MSLTDTKVKNARPAEKAVKLADGFSLYRFKILAVRLSLRWQTEGVFYWGLSLADARQRRDEAKRLLAQGIDPNAKNRLMKKSFRKSAIKPARPVSSPKADAP